MSHRSANTRPSKRQPQRWHDWQAREQENFGNQSTTGELSQLWRRRDGARTKGEFRLLGKGFTEINGGTGETTAERRTSRHEVKANNGGYEGYSISHYSNRASVPKDTRKSHERGTYTEEVRLNHLLRRAAREDDRECRLATIKLLCDFVQQADNSQILSKNLDGILRVIEEIFLEGSKLLHELRQEAAACLGLLCPALGSDASRPLAWIFTKLNSTMKEGLKTLYLSALYKALEVTADEKVLTSSMPLVMRNLQSLLENVDSPELLNQCVSCMLLLARSYPHVFSSSFRDVVDILVGWHIDHTQKMSLTKKVSGWLNCLEQFWVADLGFSLTLLSQFLEDMEAYAEDVRQAAGGEVLDEEVPQLDVSLAKLAALLRVFTTVVRSIGNRFSPSRGPPITTSYIGEVLERVVNSVEVARCTSFSEELLTAANDCVGFVLVSLDPGTAPPTSAVLSFASEQMQACLGCSAEYIVSLLSFLALIVEQVGTNLPAPFVEKLFLPSSNLLQLRYRREVEVMNSALSLYQAVLGLKNIPILEMVYKLLLGETAWALSALLEVIKREASSSEDEENWKAIVHPVFVGQVPPPDEAQSIMLFNLCALSAVGNARNSIIGMWALSPTVFSLLSDTLAVVHQDIAIHYPAIQYSVLYTLYSHCTRHDHFISSSLSSSSPAMFDGAVISTVTMATKQHFSCTLALIGSLLQQQQPSHDSRKLLLSWASEVTSLMSSSEAYSPLFLLPAFKTFFWGLLTNANHEDHLFCIKTCDSLQLLAPSLPYNLAQRCLDVCWGQLVHTNPQVRQSYTRLLRSLRLDVLLSVDQDRDFKERKFLSGVLHTHMGRQATGTFHSREFTDIMAFVLTGNVMRLGKDSWLKRLYQSCQRLSNGPRERLLGSLNSEMTDGFTPELQQSEVALWLWSMWEAAQFTVQAKLRTPLGRAQDTFQAIEGAVRSLARLVESADALEESHTDGWCVASADTDEGYVQNMWRVWMLLQFLENLEKLMYNAAEGCATAIPAPSKVIRGFFSTNRQTCREWLRRLRLAIARAALLSGQAALAVRQCFEMLTEIRAADGEPQVAELEVVVMLAVEAFCQLQSPEALQGLSNWCGVLLGRPIPWLQAAVSQADGRYEKAALDYQEVISSMTGIDCVIPCLDHATLKIANPVCGGSPRHSQGETKKTLLTRPTEVPWELVSFLADQTAECYMAIGDWDALQEWRTSVANIRNSASHSGTSCFSGLHCDINYVLALSSFEAGNFNKCREQLDLLPGEGPRLTVGDTSEYNHLCPTLMPPNPLELDKLVEGHLLRASLACLDLMESGGLVNMEDDNQQTETAKSMYRYIKQVSCLSTTPLRLAVTGLEIQLPAASILQLCYSAALQDTLSCGPSTKNYMLLWDRVSSFVSQRPDIRAWLQAIRYTSFRDFMITRIPNRVNAASQLLTHLQLTAAKLARKRGNIALAARLLSYCRNGGDIDSGKSLADMMAELSVTGSGSLGSSDSSSVTEMEIQRAKLLYITGQTGPAMEVISAHALSTCRDPSGKAPDGAFSLLTLTKWLHAEWKEAAVPLRQVYRAMEQKPGPSLTSLGRSLLELTELGQALHPTCTEGCVLPPISVESTVCVGVGEADLVLGHLHYLAAHCAPGLSKAWAALASWSYRWGRKVIDNASQGEGVDLLASERAQVETLLPKGVLVDESDAVCKILGQVVCRPAGIQDEESLLQSPDCPGGNFYEGDGDGAAEDDGIVAVKCRLLAACPALAEEGDHWLDGLVSIWQSVGRRIFGLYRISCNAYFSFLRLGGLKSKGNTNSDTEKSNTSCPAAKQNREDTVMATLRLLRLLVKHGTELQWELEHGLASTPTGVWQGIIPQLFSRLNHPESCARSSICNLLCRVAEDSPHLVLYPAVVGSLSFAPGAGNSGLSMALLGGLGEGSLSVMEVMPGSGSSIGDDVESRAFPTEPSPGPDQVHMRDSYNKIVDRLTTHNPTMVTQVRVLVAELRRITVLWDELWLGVLSQHQATALRHVQQLEDEARRVHGNSTLRKDEKIAIMREKHSALMRPVLVALEHAHTVTSASPETPHERWFQDSFGTIIDSGLAKLRDPPSLSNPGASWAPFRQLMSSLQQRIQRRGGHLRLEDISPRLASLSGTQLVLPGEGEEIGAKGSSDAPCLHSIAATVIILPTKTKPKKLCLLGSDGKTYNYLFKGLEDLHLDERIMQFLSIVNGMLRKPGNRARLAGRAGSPPFRARHYSVTPLGPRSGLIRWVDGATPLFGLYKRWQQREALAQAQKTGVETVVSGVPRPNELFYGKVWPALRAAGLSADTPRRDWPIGILCSVLQALVEETPATLLARELWCASATPQEWWCTTQTYCRSTAVMSVIGYVIGLGDRHLDNVLIDSSTGEVIHIDYNVCFEKGKSLRVPERVPFRMTQNLEMALGVTGVEGIFRLSCEQVLQAMRRSRETLLTLLEAFVYDPLVDWTSGGEAGVAGAVYGGGAGVPEARQSRRLMERDITQSLFSSRVAEIKVSWFANRDEVLLLLSHLEDAVAEIQQFFKEQDRLATEEQSLQEEKAYLEETETTTQNSVNTLLSRYEEHRHLEELHQKFQESLNAQLTDCQRWVGQYEAAFGGLQATEIARQLQESSVPLALGPPSYVPATTFLQSAGQSTVIAQCENIESDLTTALRRRHAAFMSCLDALHSYATIALSYPKTACGPGHRAACWFAWLSRLQVNPSRVTCQDIYDSYEIAFGSSRGALRTTSALAVETALQTEVMELDSQYTCQLKRMELPITDSDSNAELSLHAFITTDRDDVGTAVACMLLAALATLARQSLVMDKATHGAGEQLVELTSRDGDWFLEELYSLSRNVMSLVSFLSLCQLHPALTFTSTAVTTEHVCQAVSLANGVYIALHELNDNFRQIIFPETMRCLMKEDKSLIGLLDELQHIVQQATGGADLLRLADALQRNTEDEDFDPHLVHSVGALRLKYSELIPPQLPANHPVSIGAEDQPHPAGDAAEHSSLIETTHMSAGLMLLMAFNGMFTQVDDAYKMLLDKLQGLVIPQEWHCVDILQDACLVPGSMAQGTLSMQGFEDATFLRRLHAVLEFFSLCRANVRTFSVGWQVERGLSMDMGDAATVLFHTEDQLAHPVKTFTANFVRFFLVGLPTRALSLTVCSFLVALGIDIGTKMEGNSSALEQHLLAEKLCEAALKQVLSAGLCNERDIRRAEELVVAFDTTWKHKDLARRLNNTLTLNKASLQRARLNLTVFQWQHEDCIGSRSASSTLLGLPRATVLSNMKKKHQAFTQADATITSLQDRLWTLEGSIEQRLKWAAGANPGLADVLHEFEVSLEHRRSLLQQERERMLQTLSLCGTLLHFEALRTRTSDSIALDKGGFDILQRCRQGWAPGSTLLSTLELRLLQRLDSLGGGVLGASDWMELVRNHLNNLQTAMVARREDVGRQVEATLDRLQQLVDEMKAALVRHNHMLSSLKSLLKAMAKDEGAGENVLVEGRVRDWLAQHRDWQESTQDVLHRVNKAIEKPSGHDQTAILQAAGSFLQKLSPMTRSVCDDLVGFATPLVTDKSTESSSPPAVSASAAGLPRVAPTAKTPLEGMSPTIKKVVNRGATHGYSSSLPSLALQGVASRSIPVASPRKAVRNPKTGKAMQERNSYAVSVWKRVKAKLEGRDVDPNHRMNVTEQVDYIIKEATSVENLAQLYEGWTAWV